MRAFGYQDTRIFFLPFFGALATGRKHDASGWERGLVLLAGPGPGITIACLALLVANAPILRALGAYCAWVNVLNLAPVGLLDGGGLVRLLLGDRGQVAAARVSRAAALLLFAIAIYQRSIALGVLAFLLSASASYEGRMAHADARLRPRWPALPTSIRECPEAFFVDAASELRAELGREPRKAEHLATSLRAVHERLCRPATSSREKAVLGGIHAALFIAGVLCACARIR